MTGVLRQLSLKFLSDLSMTDYVEECFRMAVKKWEVSPERVDWIALSLREAVNNSIIHGNGNDISKMVEVVMESSQDGSIVIRVWDEGKGFNATELPDPTKEENLLRPHGRGIFLIRQFVDDVRFVCRNEGFGIELKVNSVK